MENQSIQINTAKLLLWGKAILVAGVILACISLYFKVDRLEDAVAAQKQALEDQKKVVEEQKKVVEEQKKLLEEPQVVINGQTFTLRQVIMALSQSSQAAQSPQPIQNQPDHQQQPAKDEKR